jgi:alanine racemase
MAVIKADAYGHGLLPVAKALSDVDGFAVARVEEAIDLRQAGITKPILVLTGFMSVEEMTAFSDYQLDAVIHSDYQLDILKSSDVASPISVWLKINSGMNRLGINPSEVSVISDAISLTGKVQLPIKWMTHLACADDVSSPMTEQQIQLFDDCVDGLAGEKSITNSAGLLAWQYAQRNWVRPGIMLYGGSPFCVGAAKEIGLKPVMTLKSTVISLRTIERGQAVGYGGSWRAERTLLCASIGIGYGDGYPRHAAVGTPVLIAGQRAPLVGRVSMDSINVDVSQCRDIKVGDEVVLWGEGLPIDEIAEKSETIAYELMCGITERVTRTYEGLDGE